ncbi:MAG: ATP-dependent helicase, partial [Deltaproteobacteria bacterium]|nr:ATP-dependent helicase [Deltaproteobacteria bacterium]
MTFPASTRQGLDLASLLNEEQLRAATHPGGPLLIVAGAGSGKTRTLVHRVAWLVDRGIDPASILLVTFTRKAASEMLARCASLVGDRAGRVSGGTFHSLANSILRRWAHLLGYSPSFTILDQDDSEAIIGRLRTAEIGEGAGKSTFPKKSTILGLISKSVNCGRPLSAVIKSAYPHLAEYAPRFEKIRSQYQAIKKENDQMDFDDLLVNLEAVMTADESVRQLIAGRYRHVLVDEYQDTNPVQARLTHLLGRDHQNVTAVGDEAQSIYSFRGADYTNILAFSSIFPGAAVIKLEDNYRSRPEVLSVANHLLGKAKSGFNKVLRPNRESGPKPKIILCDNLGEEAEEVVDRIGTLTGKGAALSDIAVLFRNGSHSFELEAALARARIPFSKFGGRKFLELAHVKDYLSLLRLSIRPTDPLSLSRVLSLLSGLGNKSVSLLLEFVAKRGENYRRLDQAKGPSIRVKSALREFSDTLIALNSDALSDAEKAALAHKWYSALIPSVYPDDQNHRQQDVDEILGMALSAPSLVAFLSDLALDPPNTLEVGGEAAGKRRDDLTLSTVHSAKGLEWPYVFVISAVDGRFPSPYLRTEAEAEEELRLMYVAVTRAKDELTITVPLG